MKIFSFCLVFSYVLLHVHEGSSLSRLDFPPSFVFGAGTSAYQVEGAAAEDGRKPSIWDNFAHRENDMEEGTGDVAANQYHKYKEDVKLMYDMGLDAYRCSISWSRLIPDGHGAVNPKGLEYYNNLFDQLVLHGIEPHVTLNHYDLPQALQVEYGGYPDPKFIDDFTAYADFCFKEFGDRVKYWITFNQPNTDIGFTKCFSPFEPECSSAGLTITRYIPAHNVLLAHAAAAHLYKTKYQEKQKGKIGITFLSYWFEPVTNSTLDVNKAEYKLDFDLGWFLDPLVYGKYPDNMRESLGSQLPNLTQEESARVKGSFDFIGVNYYYGYYVRGDIITLENTKNNPVGAPGFATVRYGDSKISGSKKLDESHFLPDGLGLGKLLDYLNQKYKNPLVFIHENGYGISSAGPSSQNDTERISYLEKNIQSLLEPLRNGSNVKGYFVWSFIDGFELFGGYNAEMYGLYGVDFSDKNRTRYARQSAHWYGNFLGKLGRNLKGHSYTV